MVFLILSFLEIGADHRQKSISVEFSFDTVLARQSIRSSKRLTNFIVGYTQQQRKIFSEYVLINQPTQV